MIYVSTGGFSSLNFYQACQAMSKVGLTQFELSAGSYTADVREQLGELSRDYKLALHNYFPVPATPFVFNLASNNTDIALKSMAHAKQGVDLSALVGSKYFSFHAGYLFDPDPSMLGRELKFIHKIAPATGIRNFTARVAELADYAIEREVKLLVENNVLSHANALLGHDNPLMASCPESTAMLFAELPANVGLLVDVAHLKVSANTLGYCPYAYLERFDNLIDGYHLSDNNGFEDSNQAFCEDSWFWRHLKKEVDYVSIEVYSDDLTLLKAQYDLVTRRM